jgi:hypothetical protein
MHVTIDRFIDLGSTLASEVKIDDKVITAESLKPVPFSAGYTTPCKGIATETKLSVNRAAVLTTLLHVRTPSAVYRCKTHT